MKSLMSSSNTAEQRLDRVFHEADELIFEAAKSPDPRLDRDNAAKAIYKGLIAFHQVCRCACAPRFLSLSLSSCPSCSLSALSCRTTTSSLWCTRSWLAL
jgi:hypothetical protein